MQSKLAQILFTFDLAQRLRGTGVTVNCLHPASYMATTMVREAGVTPWSTVEQGAEAILNLATSPTLEGRGGLYFDGRKESRANAQAYDRTARAKLRALSLELAGLSGKADSGRGRACSRFERSASAQFRLNPLGFLGVEGAGDLCVGVVLE